MSANLTVKVVDPTFGEGWNELVSQAEKSTVFHTANWARLLTETYGFFPRYFVVQDSEHMIGCLPVTEVRSLLTGKRGVSLSFSDYCSSLLRSADDFHLLLKNVLELARLCKWQYVEFRGEPLLESEVPAKTYAHHVLQLSVNETLMVKKLRETTLRNIKKALKEGVTVTVSSSVEGVRTFYRLHCLTRKRHGIPPQPVHFFENLYKYLISCGMGFTAIASHHQRPVAAMICLRFGKNAIYKYGASDFQFQHLRANNLLLWECIRTCASYGCTSFSLGRTDWDNEGLLQFKNGWGAEATNILYHRYDVASGKFLSGKNTMPTYQTVIRKLPIAVLKIIGRLAYRHLG